MRGRLSESIEHELGGLDLAPKKKVMIRVVVAYTLVPAR